MLKFSTILDFQTGITSQSDIEGILGEPSDVVQKDGYFIMNYNDPEKGYQRLLLTVNMRNKKLLSLLWIPEEDELESSLEYAKKIVESAHYRVEEDKKIPSHMVTSGILFYIDKKAGITIRYDKTRSKVEAIALYDRDDRIPTSVK